MYGIHESFLSELSSQTVWIFFFRLFNAGRTNELAPIRNRVDARACLGEDENVAGSLRHEFDEAFEVLFFSRMRVELSRFLFRERLLLVLDDVEVVQTDLRSIL